MENRGKVYLVVGVIAAVGLLLSVVLGAAAGGLAGYFVGREQARAVVDDTLGGGVVQQQELVMPPWEQAPQSPQTPERTPFSRRPTQIPSAGAYVSAVTPGTPAEAAGLQAGDVIVAINGERVTLTMDLAQIVQKYKPGDTIKLTYSRSGAETTVDVTLATHPDNPERPLLGVTYSSGFTPQE